MLKTLKWIYKLGYKHAENKYYHTLMKKLNEKNREIDFLMDIEKPDKQTIDRKRSETARLSHLIEEVFKPEVQVTNEPIRFIDRFES